MNVGYGNLNEQNPVDEICPICKSDIYINKWGTDYLCMNKECVLNRKASVVVKEIELIMEHYRKKEVNNESI